MMKKLLIFTALLVLLGLNAYADDTIDVSDLYVAPKIIEGDYAEPGDMLVMNVHLKEYDHDFDNSQIMVYVDDMRMYDVVGPFEINSKNRDQKFYLEVPEDAKKGPHYAKIIVYNGVGWRVLYRDFYVI